MPLDDAFEFWGGSVNLKHALVTGGNDDDYDMDEGFKGFAQYLINVKYPASIVTQSDDPHGWEMDGTSSDNKTPAATELSSPRIANFTSVGYDIYTATDSEVLGKTSRGLRAREGFAGIMSNGLVYGYHNQDIHCNDEVTGVTGYLDPSLTVLSSQIDSAGTTSNTAAASCDFAGAALTLAASPITSGYVVATKTLDLTPSSVPSCTLDVTALTAGVNATHQPTASSFFDASTFCGAIASTSEADQWWKGWTKFSHND
jgi:hypothetical protein